MKATYVRMVMLQRALAIAAKLAVSNALALGACQEMTRYWEERIGSVTEECLSICSDGVIPL